MKRVIKFERKIIDTLSRKYVLQNEYEGFGIYEEMASNGYLISQSWVIANEKINLVCDSFNNFCKEELLDMIDNYNQTKKFGIKGKYKTTINEVDIYIAHPNYENTI